jgi:hypothetical protein
MPLQAIGSDHLEVACIPEQLPGLEPVGGGLQDAGHVIPWWDEFW